MNIGDISIEEPIAASALKSVELAIERFKNGQMVIIVDDEDRENEGDLAVLGESASPQDINFMASVGRGLICTPMSKEYIERLNIPMMASRNNAPMNTAFTVTVDAADGITTGISASDRAATIRLLADEKSIEQDFVSPGHIFPLKAHEGGVLVRTGQTEGSVDLAIMAGKKPIAVICEIMKDDGTMARMDDLKILSKKYDIPIVTIADMVAYRMAKETLIERKALANVPTAYGKFNLAVYKSKVDPFEHVAIYKGAISEDIPTLVRVHSECLTGDIFCSLRCECGDQLRLALKIIGEKNGVLIYMRQEGRGIGLVNKIKAYALQDEKGFDTVDANKALGYPIDLRHYGVGAQILRDLGVSKFNLLTNNPRKVVGLKGFGLELVDVLALTAEERPENSKYLKTKRERLGHDV